MKVNLDEKPSEKLGGVRKKKEKCNNDSLKNKSVNKSGLHK